MNKYIYHSETNSFYPVSLKDDYMSSGSWPESGVEISESEFIRFTNPPPGKYRVAGDDGYPALADIPPLTHEQEVSKAENNRQSLLANANAITADWRTELALNIISDEDKSRLIEWMQYIKAVKAVDTSTAPNITWPDQPR